jgi:hypothetical protein
VLVDWNVPAFNGGSPVTAYKVLIRQDNLIYSEEQVNCDGSQSQIVADTSCSVPVATLMASPFNLPWGSKIYAAVIAINAYGESAVSEPGFGAIILTVPDAPIQLQEVAAQRTDNSITISW